MTWFRCVWASEIGTPQILMNRIQ